MTPIKFQEANTRFGPPPDLDAFQCGTIYAHWAIVTGGNLDGSEIVIVAWQPDDEDRKRIAEGGPVYLSMIGGLAPHALQTDFKAATMKT